MLIPDAGLLVWVAMAALMPERLPGPGSAPILAGGYEGFTKQSWQDLADTSPLTVGFMTVLFRVYGPYIVAFALLAITVGAIGPFELSEYLGLAAICGLSLSRLLGAMRRSPQAAGTSRGIRPG